MSCHVNSHTRTTVVLKPIGHRRRIYTEEKAKVIAAVRGTELIKFLTAPG